MSQNTGVVVNGDFSAQHIYNPTEIGDQLNLKVGGVGSITFLPKFKFERTLTNSSIQEDAHANVGISGPPITITSCVSQGMCM